jgi:enoyl-CoA hydratase/carnithine racemase
MSADKEHVLSISIADKICLLTLDRPHRRNALSEQLQGELREAVLDADSNPDVSLVAITGAGDQAFCAGVDLKEMRERDTGQG